jgi:hypothetical protein
LCVSTEHCENFKATIYRERKLGMAANNSKAGNALFKLSDEDLDLENHGKLQYEHSQLKKKMTC